MHDHPGRNAPPCAESRPGPGESPVAAAGFDDFETGVLAIARYCFASFARPETDAWLVALSVASQRFGPERGPRIASGVAATVQAMRRARRSVFRFSNPFCPDCRLVLTANERLLIRTIGHLRTGAEEAAAATAFLLCEANPAERFLAEAGALARLAALPAHSP